MHLLAILEFLLSLLALSPFLLVLGACNIALLRAFREQQREAEAAHLITIQGTAEKAAEKGTESIEDTEGTGSID